MKNSKVVKGIVLSLAAPFIVWVAGVVSANFVSSATFNEAKLELSNSISKMTANVENINEKVDNINNNVEKIDEKIYNLQNLIIQMEKER